MRCIANVFLKQKAKCILRNVEILISHEVQPFPRNMEDFEICIDKFYEYFMFGRRDITTALEEYTDIFEKYNVTSIVPKRMLLLIFENVVDYLDLIDNPELFNWYYLVAKLILLNLIFEEYSNSITEKKFSYEKIMIGNVFNRDEKNYLVLFDNYKNYKVNSYINNLIKNSDETVYKVDMSLSENASHISDESNKNATSSEELRINDVTLIKISKGKIVKYLTGSEEIESYLE